LARRSALSALWLVCAGCSGQIGDAPPSTGSAEAPAGVPGSDTRAATPGAPATTAPRDPACGAGVDPGPVFLRRLTHPEYRRAVHDLTGSALDVTTSFPGETAINGFRNNAEGIPVSTLQTERYGDAASRLASDLIATPSLRGAWLGTACATPTAANRTDCTDQFVKRFGERAFRRPLTADEVARYDALAATAAGDPNVYMGLGLVVRAMLQSPKFLYRVEVGAAGADPAKPAAWRKLDGYEIATRLSFLLWGTAPDAALMTAASQKRLDTPDGVRAMAAELLKSERSKEPARELYGQWLGFDALPYIERDPAAFPSFTESLRSAMAQESQLFVDNVLWAPDASVLDLVGAQYGFVNGALATHYKKKGVSGTAFSRVTFDDADGRGGLLGLASVLSVTWKPDVDPILRGKYVREGLLCQRPPPPPPDVGPLPKAAPNETQRERLARHRTDPTCSVCHNLFDPIGFGLERYDGIGALRSTDAQGHPLTGEGKLDGAAKPDFVGMRELSLKIKESPLFPACVATQAFRYSFGRSEVGGDACALRQLTDAFVAGGHHYADLILAIAGSDAFRYRRADAGEKP
jgi:hypothetical protein